VNYTEHIEGDGICPSSSNSLSASSCTIVPNNRFATLTGGGAVFLWSDKGHLMDTYTEILLKNASLRRKAFRRDVVSLLIWLACSATAIGLAIGSLF
jgi:hypothetical protein